MRYSVAHYFNRDLLVTESEGEVLLSLRPLHGRPVQTEIFRKDASGKLVKVGHYSGEIHNATLGHSEEVRLCTFSIHSSLEVDHDIPEEDQHSYLEEKLSCGTKDVQAIFKKTTHGRHNQVNCTYEVTIM